MHACSLSIHPWQNKKRGSFRAEVNMARNTIPDLSSSRKRKAPLDSVGHTRALKRCHAIEGLHSDWKAQGKHGGLRYTASGRRFAANVSDFQGLIISEQMLLVVKLAKAQSHGEYQDCFPHEGTLKGIPLQTLYEGQKRCVHDIFFQCVGGDEACFRCK